LGFKDQLAKDVRSTFLNPNEFGELITMDGREIIAVLESNAENDHPLKHAYGLSIHQIVLHIDEEELGFRPVQGSRTEINGEKFYVVSTKSEAGMLSVTLDRNQG